MTNVKLNDLQLVLLAHALQNDRGDMLPLPASVTDEPRARKAIEQLLKRGLVTEQSGATVPEMWRNDGDQAFGVVITDAGRTAIGAGEQDSEDGEAQGAAPSPAPVPASEPAPPRATKRAAVIALLKREGGATLDDMIAATGWLPHTTRAALTGLKKAGMQLDSQKLDCVRRYRIVEAG